MSGVLGDNINTNECPSTNDEVPPTFVDCNGLRYAIPYESTTSPTFIKDRFVGETLDVVLGTMFRRKRGTQPVEQAAAHWYSEIAAGRVEVRGRKISREDPWEWKVATIPPESVTQGTSVRLHQHVHEKVVESVDRIEVLFENEKWLAINKPGGLATVDEMGVTGINSLMTMVAEECYSRAGNSKNLKLQPAHRLDKPVSGVLLIGKSPASASQLLREIQRGPKGESGGVEKIYVARVRRNPESVVLVRAAATGVACPAYFREDITVEAELGWDNRNKRAVVMCDGDTKEAAERALVRKASLEGTELREAKKKRKREERQTGRVQLPCEDSKMPGKACHIHTTRFRPLGKMQLDGTLLVECRPLTGQRHQIRAHLAALGWPIANDTIYGGSTTDGQDEMAVGTKRLCAYVDNKAGILAQVLGSPQVVRSWCTKCQWMLQMLASTAGDKQMVNGTASSVAANNVEGGREGGLQQIFIEGHIWLHSHRYILPGLDLDICASLPDWAQSESMRGDVSDQTTDGGLPLSN